MLNKTSIKICFPAFPKIMLLILALIINFGSGLIAFLQTNSPTMNGVASNVFSMDAIASNQFVLMNSNSTPSFEMVITTLDLTSSTYAFTNSSTTLTAANSSTFIKTT